MEWTTTATILEGLVDHGNRHLGEILRDARRLEEAEGYYVDAQVYCDQLASVAGDVPFYGMREPALLKIERARLKLLRGVRSRQRVINVMPPTCSGEGLRPMAMIPCTPCRLHGLGTRWLVRCFCGVGSLKHLPGRTRGRVERQAS